MLHGIMKLVFHQEDTNRVRLFQMGQPTHSFGLISYFVLFFINYEYLTWFIFMLICLFSLMFNRCLFILLINMIYLFEQLQDKKKREKKTKASKFLLFEVFTSWYKLFNIFHCRDDLLFVINFVEFF